MTMQELNKHVWRMVYGMAVVVALVMVLVFGPMVLDTIPAEFAVPVIVALVVVVVAYRVGMVVEDLAR